MTISYKGDHLYNKTGVTSYKDFLYEVVPEFLQTQADESFHTRIFTFVDHTIYWKIEYKFPNPNKLSALAELNDIKWHPIYIYTHL